MSRRTEAELTKLNKPDLIAAVLSLELAASEANDEAALILGKAIEEAEAKAVATLEANEAALEEVSEKLSNLQAALEEANGDTGDARAKAEEVQGELDLAGETIDGLQARLAELNEALSETVTNAAETGVLAPMAFYLSGRAINGNLSRVRCVGADLENWVVERQGKRGPEVLHLSVTVQDDDDENPTPIAAEDLADYDLDEMEVSVKWVQDMRGEPSHPDAIYSRAGALLAAALVKAGGSL